MGEKLGIAGSGAIATGLAACATQTPGHLLWARSDASAARATKAIAKACERLGEGFDAGQRHRHDRPRGARERDVPRRGDLRGHGAQERAAGAPRRAGRPTTRCSSTTTSSLSVSELAAASGHRRALRRPARLQPRAADEARRARLPRGGDATPRASAPRRSARSSARSPSTCPTSRASSSTGCCFPTSSAPWTSCSRRACRRPRSTRACSSARPIRWGRSRCWTTSASTSPWRSATRSGPTCPQSLRDLCAEGALGRKAGRGLYPPEFYAR